MTSPMPDPAERARAVATQIHPTCYCVNYGPCLAECRPLCFKHKCYQCLVTTALRAERAAVWKEAANLMTKQPRNGGFWPHACSSCGRDDEEHHAIEAERVLLNKIAAALAARGEET